MRINKDSRPWIIACLLMLAAATAVYMPYAARASRVGGASGGTWLGIIFGSAGSAMMLFALLLGLKKRFRTMRVGRAYTWLQGHVWLGLLSYPIILYHSGWRFGGLFTSIIMWLFTIVIVTGIIGLVLQQYMPGIMRREVEFETVYEQIDHVVAQLRDEAEHLVRSIIGESGGEAFEVEAVPAGGTTATLADTSVLAAKTVKDLYETQIKPFMAKKIPGNCKIKTRHAAVVIFDNIRVTLPRDMHDSLNDLAQIVEERRQLALQRKLQHRLYWWLMIHVPASYALMLLAAWHAISALRYVSPHW